MARDGPPRSRFPQVLESAIKNPSDAFLPRDPYELQFIDIWDVGLPYTLWHILDQVYRQVYRHLLLRLPSMYFSRLYRVFTLSNVATIDTRFTYSYSEVQHSQWANIRFQALWDSLVDSLISEWNTLNVIAILLVGAILTLLQIDAAANQPATRTLTFLSLVTALMSVIYCCLYIVRFGTLKNKWRAAGFTQAMQATKKYVLWNVLILLSIPAAWLSWSLIFFSAAILSFLWTAGSDHDAADPPRNSVELGPRIAISAVFGVGIIYLILVMYNFSLYVYENNEQAALEEAINGTPAAYPAAETYENPHGYTRYQYNNIIPERRTRRTPREYSYVPPSHSVPPRPEYYVPHLPPYPDPWGAAHPWPAYPSVPTPPDIYGQPRPVPVVIPAGVEPSTAGPAWRGPTFTGRRRETSESYAAEVPSGFAPLDRSNSGR